MRYFGAIGHPPDRFYRAAIAALIEPDEERVAALKAAWEKLGKEERIVFGIPRFPKLRNEEHVRDICKGISDAYNRRRSFELTPPCVWRVLEARKRLGGILRDGRALRYAHR